MLDAASRSYRRALWDDQDDAVIILSEKDAISGVVAPTAVIPPTLKGMRDAGLL